jgi:hypothetical protein
VASPLSFSALSIAGLASASLRGPRTWGRSGGTEARLYLEGRLRCFFVLDSLPATAGPLLAGVDALHGRCLRGGR